jgi:hypothetical protein
VHTIRLDPEWPGYYEFSERSITPRTFERDGYELTAAYPQISSSSREAREFNTWIERKVVGYASDFERRVNAEQRKWRRPRQLWGLNLSYVVCYSTERMISLRLARGLMETGQMHPISYFETINYDLQQRRPLRVTDVFKPGYLKVFSTYSRKELADRYTVSDPELMKSGTRPVTDNFANWNIVRDGVLLSFDDYQVGPHSFGQAEFVVPFYLVRDTLRLDTVRKLLGINKPLK